MRNNKLSFCIPTYNRAEFIIHTLTSIADQIIEGDYTDIVEICVSDNASIDGTDEIINSFKNNYPSVQIVYSKNSENLGADKNYLKVVELASGEYCWLMGSDDALVPGAINRIRSEINHGHDIYLCNRTECDLGLNPINDGTWLSREIEDSVYNLSNKSELVNYFNASQSIGAVFSYISSIIVSRNRWKEVAYDDALMGSNYIHVLRLLSISKDKCVLKYIKEPLVLCRLGNDSFAQQGDVKRFLIDLDGYLALANKLFSNDNETKEAFLRVMTREYPWYRLIKIRAFANRDVSWKSIRDKLLEFHFDKRIVNLAGVLGKLESPVFLALYVKRKL